MLALGVSLLSLWTAAVIQSGPVGCRMQAQLASHHHLEFLELRNDQLRRELDVARAELRGLRERPTGHVAQLVQCGEHGWVADRAALLDVLQHPEPYVGRLRVVPAIQDGERRGFKLFGLAPGAPLWALGLRNGDLLTTFNGHPLGVEESVMETYTVIREVDTLVIDFERRGEPRQIMVELR